jgi:hypothetical protein
MGPVFVGVSASKFMKRPTPAPGFLEKFRLFVEEAAGLILR